MSLFAKEIVICGNTFVLKDGNTYIIYSPFSGNITRTKFSPLDSPDLFRSLEIQGFFGELPISTKKYEQWKGFTSLALLLTRQCSLRCIYCYASGGSSNQSMSINLALDALKWYLFQLKSSKIGITFHGGGEPTLEKEIIKEVVEYAEENKNGREARYLITTNGIVEEEFLDWMLENNFAISVSMDGPPEIQNKNRPLADGSPSSELVEKTILCLLDKKSSFTVRITYSVSDDLSSIVHYFGKMGVKSLHLEPLFPFGRSPGLEKFVKKDKFISEFLRALNVCRSYGIKVFNSHLMHFTKGIGYFCGSASGKSMTVTHDGLLTGCLEVVDSNDPDIIFFRLGRWHGWLILQQPYHKWHIISAFFYCFLNAFKTLISKNIDS